MSSNNIYINKLKLILNENKYSRWYFSIIEKSLYRMNYSISLRDNKKNQVNYYEAHHILPSCLCDVIGKKDLNNLVLLTPKEHIICHMLLCKSVKEKIILIKLINALLCMFRACDNHKRDVLESKSLFYARIRENFSSGLKGVKKPDGFGEKIRKANLGLKKSEETRSKISDKRKESLDSGRGVHPWKNKKMREVFSSEEYEKYLGNCKKNSAHIGADNGFYGKTHSEETIELNKLKHIKIVLRDNKYLHFGSSNLKKKYPDSTFVILGKKWDFINNNIVIDPNWIVIN